MAGLRVAS